MEQTEIKAEIRTFLVEITTKNNPGTIAKLN